MAPTAILPPTYRAFLYKQYGKIEDVLEIHDVATEPLEPSFVRIKVRSAALNPVDHKFAEVFGQLFTGESPSADKPYRAGQDVAGVIVEVGSEAEGKFRVGDEVFAMAPITRVGTLAQYVAVDASLVALKPKTLDWNKAAAAPLVSLTSYQALVDHAKLTKNERMLVIGGSTSVGIYAIQHAKALGAYVIATASTRNLELVQSLGADQVIDYTAAKWPEVIPAHSLDVVYECSVEPEAWDRGAQTVLKKTRARYVTLVPGQSPSAPVFEATHSAVFTHPSGEQLAKIAHLIDSGKIQVVVDSVFPFKETREAYSLLKSGRVRGKVVVELE